MSNYIFPWTKKDLRKLEKIRSPFEVQSFLDNSQYNKSSKYLMPDQVLNNRSANCFDGAIFAATVLDFLGMPPLLMDLRAVRDDDHVLAVFKQNGSYGAIAKSNFTGLRYREPVYKTTRELAVSYFNDYFNLKRERTLREFSGLYNLKRNLKQDWYKSRDFFYQFAFVLDGIKHYSVISQKSLIKLNLIDIRTFKAGKLGQK